jgi:putative tricarboxylic transport membrane protein
MGWRVDTLIQGLQLIFTTPLGPAAIGGVAWGILGGALPGISPSISMALLLPFTYGMDPASAIVLLAATYVGAEYGGSIPAILINTPGTNAAAATVLDGYPMAQRGEGGLALGISLYSGVIGGFFGLVMLVLLTEPLAALALVFTPMSYFALGVLGLSMIASLSGRSILKGLAAGLLGLMIATVGTDPISGVPRFTFGQTDLLDGVAPILVMVGLFAVSELLRQASLPAWKKALRATARLRFPDGPMRRMLLKSQLIGSVIGTFEGVIPGAGGTIAHTMKRAAGRRTRARSGTARPRVLRRPKPPITPSPRRH